jgi:hypothetical protein
VSLTTGASGRAPERTARHDALLYAGADEFLASTVPFIYSGLVADQPVLVVVDHLKADLLRATLGADGRDVTFADLGDTHRHPDDFLSAWVDFARAHTSDNRLLRAIGEPVSAAMSSELFESRQCEPLLDLACVGLRQYCLRCLYDADTVGAEALAEARTSHAIVLERGARRLGAA